MLFCVLLPFWLSVLVRAFAWVMLLRREGAVNSTLLALGVIDSPLTLVRNEFGVIVGMIHYMLPYAILPLYAAMDRIDPRLLLASDGLYASMWNRQRIAEEARETLARVGESDASDRVPTLDEASQTVTPETVADAAE